MKGKRRSFKSVKVVSIIGFQVVIAKVMCFTILEKHFEKFETGQEELVMQ